MGMNGHCTTAFSMQCSAQSANQPYADEYHRSVCLQTSAYGHFNDTHLHIFGLQTLYTKCCGTVGVVRDSPLYTSICNGHLDVVKT